MNEKQLNHISTILNTQCIKVYKQNGNVFSYEWLLSQNTELETFNRLYNFVNLNNLSGSVNLEIEYNQPLLKFIIEL